MSFIVICRNDDGDYVLATRRHFDGRIEAIEYAKTIAKGREPIVAEAETSAHDLLIRATEAIAGVDAEDTAILPDGSVTEWDERLRAAGALRVPGKRKLRSGDRVTWTDPDGGACSRTLTIASIEYREDESVLIVDTEGGELEALPDELEKIAALEAQPWRKPDPDEIARPEDIADYLRTGKIRAKP